MAENHYSKAYKLFRDSIPDNSCAQTHINMFVKEIITKKVPVILDLGCGEGKSANLLSTLADRYIGVDIADSPESMKREIDDLEFYHFDGVNIPLPDESVDVVFMKQVLEHVLEPWRLIPEIRRVLKKDGILVGSVSQLEPFHSYSTFNYTPYGICAFLDLFGLEVFRLRPGMDGISIINRAVNKFIIARGSDLEDTFWTKDSPLNYTLEKYLARKSKTTRDINYYKLIVCGQFCFAARK